MEENKNKFDNIVISSRIRLARNLKNKKFNNKISQEEAYEIVDDVKNVIENNEITSQMGFKLYYLKDMPEIEQKILIEKRVISPQMVKNKDKSAFFVSEDKKITIMLNEEDHIRIQVLDDKMCLNKCLDLSNKIDDILEEKLDYAFDNQLGYLTSCPTNIGTGMRASTMLHLPALAMTNQLEKILLAISQIGVAVRGVYGEGTKSMGNIYQISNQGTLGAQEETLIERIRQITAQIVEKENDTRNKLLQNSRIYIEDEVYRAYGLLKNARIIQVQEAMRHLSMLKMGIEMGILDIMNSKEIDRIMITIQENSVKKLLGDSSSIKDGFLKRAEILRSEIK